MKNLCLPYWFRLTFCSVGFWVVSVLFQPDPRCPLYRIMWGFTKEALINLWWILMSELTLLVWFITCTSYSFLVSLWILHYTVGNLPQLTFVSQSQLLCIQGKIRLLYPLLLILYASLGDWRRIRSQPGYILNSAHTSHGWVKAWRWSNASWLTGEQRSLCQAEWAAEALPSHTALCGAGHGTFC